jgi:uncharacterized protein
LNVEVDRDVSVRGGIVRRTMVPAALLLAISIGLSAEPLPRRTLSVAGTAEVSVAPDICYMTFSTETRSRSAIQAYRENNAAMTTITDAVKKQGVEPKDLQTARFTIAPEYHYEKSPNRRVFDGYRVTNTLNVKVRKLDKVSNVLDAAMEAGTNNIEQVTFTVENPKKYTADARVEALKAARAKAEKIAEVTGVKLGRPLSISENEPGGWGRYYAQANVALDRAEPASMDMPVEPGEMKLTHTVNITYEIE